MSEEMKEYEISVFVTEKRKRLLPAAWMPCCRCFPSAVGDDGFCGCCLYNHRTGERLKKPDFDYLGEPLDSGETGEKT